MKKLLNILKSLHLSYNLALSFFQLFTPFADDCVIGIQKIADIHSDNIF